MREAVMPRSSVAHAATPRVHELRRLLVGAGWVAAAVIVVSTATNGLPADTGAATATVALTVAALILWLISLVPDVTDTRVLTACLVGTGISGAVLDLLHPSGPGYILAFMAVAGIGLRLPRREGLIAGGIVVVTAGAAEAATSDHPLSGALNLAIGAGFLFMASTFAAVNRDAHTRAEELLAQEAATRAARQEAAVLAERSRLAREMHDVLAHTLSGLAVQLEGARLLAQHTGADPRLTEQVGTAQRLARDGMANARRAVATLRGDALPGVDQIRDLVEQTRRSAGLPVTVAHTGEPRPLPPETGLAVYRTVQEALTNTTKHAGRGATATVTLHWEADRVIADIVDAGGDRVPAGLPSGGFGLNGVAERAALAGGRLETGPTDTGWRVRLSMPTTIGKDR
jgi:signal transduction histidine kinase